MPPGMARARCLLVALVIGCSDDAPAGPALGAGGSGGGSTSGSGGAAGGRLGGGGAGGSEPAGSGGADPVLARGCGIDAGVAPCRTCLAVGCCEPATACFASTGCSAAFDAYQACVEGKADDVSACFSTFARAALADSPAHQPLLTCIATDGCAVCGAPAVL